jgi:DNA-binding CsgD family transcriptional regulator
VNAALMALTGAAPSVVLMVAEGAKAIGFGGVASSAYAALAVCDIARRDYRDAYERLRPMVEAPFLHLGSIYHPDYVEAAHRSGHAVEATRYAHALSALADDNGSSTCRGVAERSLALVDSGDGAEAHYLAAIDALTGTRAEIDLARTHLVYGEWLRRAKRRREASQQLHCALTIFRDEGGDVFVARTQAELEAAGGKANTPRERYSTDLTAQELSIGRLAADGHTNVEIAAKLFVSPNTVDYHLRKVFQKLGVSSRRQLADRLSAHAE